MRSITASPRSNGEAQGSEEARSECCGRSAWQPRSFCSRFRVACRWPRPRCCSWGRRSLRALERDGTRSVPRAAAGAAMPAWIVVRRHPPRYRRLLRPCRAAEVGRDRPGCRGRAQPVMAAAMGLAGLLYALGRSRLWRNGAHGRGRRLAGARRPPDGPKMSRRRRALPGDDQRQVGYIVASSRPLRYIMRRERPPRRVIQLRTCSG